MPDDGDAQILQVLRRQLRQDLFADRIVAESGLVLFEAEAPQPDHDVHNSAPNSGLPYIIMRSGESVQELPKAAAGVSGVNRCHHKNSTTLTAHISSAN